MSGTSSEWGRVADDGTVFVKTSDGERPVGQVPDSTPEEALAIYVKRYADLETDVSLLEQRVRAGLLSPEAATASIKSLRETLPEASAVGDLVALVARLDALGPVLATQRAARKEQKAQELAQSKSAKEGLVGEAEKIAEGKDWRNGANRMRDLLTKWKELPRLDKSTDDELWHRFSGARTAYTKRRKAHFAEMDEKRAGSQVVKQRLVKEAEALSTSTDWGLTAGRYRDLMRDWKAAGPAPREVEETLWQQFRAAQDAFFGARDAENAKVDAEFAANAEVKRALLVEAEALLPITNLEAAKRAFRDLAEKWDAAGKVPRGDIKDLEGRMRKVENALKSVEDDKWRRQDQTARADDMVGKFQAAINKLQADLDKARTTGDTRKAKDLEAKLTSQQAFLDMARRSSAGL
ncbi:MAG: DUF349 domain-containing protein [Nocardioides sp.]|jgi:hypothetical protein